MLEHYWGNPDVWVKQSLASTSLESSDRQIRTKQIRAAYETGMPDELAPRKRPDGSTEPDDNVKSNKIRYIVDKSRRAVIGNGESIVSIKEDHPLAIEAWNRYEQRSKFSVLLVNLLTDGALCGHNFVEFHEPDSDGALPRVVKLDPMSVTPIYNENDYELIEGYVINWITTGNKIRRRKIERTEDGYWDKIDQELRENGNEDDPMDWFEIGRIEWSYQWCPVIDWQNLPAVNAFWGRPDIDVDDYSLARKYNRTMSDGVRSERALSNPVRYGWGLPKIRALKAIAQKMSPFKGSGDREVHEDRPATNLLPGDFVHVTDKDGFIKHDAAKPDIDGVIKLARNLEEDLFMQTGTVNLRHEKIAQTGAQSGLAIKLLYGDQEEKAQDKRILYGPAMKLIVIRVLEMMGIDLDEEDVMLTWPSAIPSNEKEELENAQKKAELGVSARTVMEELGYNHEEEISRNISEQQEQAEAHLRMMQEMDRGHMHSSNDHGQENVEDQE